MNPKDNEIVSLSDGEIVIWVDGESSLHMKCITRQGDPVELNYDGVNDLCQVLQKLAERIR